MEALNLDSAIPPTFISRLRADLSAVWAPLALLLLLAAAAFVAGFLRHYGKLGFLLRRYNRKGKSVISSTPSYDTDSDDESVSSNSDTGADEDEEMEDASTRPSRYYGADEGQNGNNRFSWDGGSIVRTWSSGLFGFDLVDLDHDESIHSFDLASGNDSAGDVNSIGMATPAVVMAAGPTAMRLWDARTASGAAATEAVLRRRVSGDGEAVVPELRGGREAEMERWWDDSENGGRRGRGVGPVVVEWCRDVVRRLPVLPSPK